MDTHILDGLLLKTRLFAIRFNRQEIEIRAHDGQRQDRKARSGADINDIVFVGVQFCIHRVVLTREFVGVQKEGSEHEAVQEVSGDHVAGVANGGEVVDAVPFDE